MDWPEEIIKRKNGTFYAKIGFDDISALRALQEQWKIGNERTVIIYGENGEPFPCQKNFLVTISGHFRSLFERLNHQLNSIVFPTIQLDKKVPIELFKRLLEIALTGIVEISDDWTLKDLITAAHFMQMESIRVRLCDLIRRSQDLSISTVVWLYMSQKDHGDAGLSEMAEKQLLCSFDKAIDSEMSQLVKFSAEQWISILSNEEMFSLNENKIFSAVCEWVGRDPANRSKSFPAIAAHFRIGPLDKILLVQNMQNQPAVVHQFINAMAGSLAAKEALKQFGYPLSKTNGIAFKPRTVEVLLQVVEKNKTTQLSCVRPNVATKNTAVLFRNIPHRDFKPLGRSLDNVVYVECGGDIWSFEPAANKWKQLTKDRITRKHNLALKTGTYYDGLLYLLFIGRGERFCSCCPRDQKAEHDDELDDYLESEFVVFDVEQTGRSTLPSLNHEFHKKDQPVMIGHAGSIYLFLGDKYFVYSTEVSTWSRALDLPSTRSRRSACVGPDGNIYVAGIVESPTCLRKSVSLICVQDQIVLTGDSSEDSFEVYDHEDNSWTVRKFAPSLANLSHGNEFPAFSARVTASVFKPKETGSSGIKRPAPP